MWIPEEELDDSAVFFSLMHCLDQAFLTRQGMGAQDSGDWGERFFAAFDALFPAWADQEKEIYLAASKMLYTFAYSQTHPMTRCSLVQKPEILVRMIILLLKNNLV
jgi:hypothetical protein